MATPTAKHFDAKLDTLIGLVGELKVQSAVNVEAHERIKDSIDVLATRVGAQNGRVSKIEEWKEKINLRMAKWVGAALVASVVVPYVLKHVFNIQ